MAGPGRAVAQPARRRRKRRPPTPPGAANLEKASSALHKNKSPLACFQWGLLALREKRLSLAMEWLRQAVANDPRNHWYQYFLAYLEDLAGYKDEALARYNFALFIEPDSPWILFSRARIYRSKGSFDTARKDMENALSMMKGRPEAGRVHLELGYLYHELGNFRDARNEYDKVIKLDISGLYAPAARLNLANMDAESGAVDRARQEYDTLLASDLRDHTARLSRALLELREGQATARILIVRRYWKRRRKPVIAIRCWRPVPVALLLLNRPAEAIADATAAQNIRPGPAHERLRQRAILAARRTDLLQLDLPDEVALFPLGGRHLAIDLRNAANDLWRLAGTRSHDAYRASLNMAVILAALEEHKAALATATRALELSPYSPRAYLIRARIRYFGGDRQGARADVGRGLAIQFNEPGLLELAGILKSAAGDHKAAVDLFDNAIVWGAIDRVHLHKAAALMALSETEKSVAEWSLASEA